jgi:hypothetical protein
LEDLEAGVWDSFGVSPRAFIADQTRPAIAWEIEEDGAQ